MTLPSFPTERTIKTLAGLGGGVVVAIFALYILWQVVFSGQVALSQDISVIKEGVSTLLGRREITKAEHDAISELEKVNAAEAKKQTKLLQRICLNGAKTQQAINDCLAD
jgi:hypothetical protein